MSNLFHEVYKEEQQALEKWAANHTCGHLNAGAIGGSITYSLTPTNLGTITMVQCSCGAEHDATEYEAW